jgi:hypothetical protein
MNINQQEERAAMAALLDGLLVGARQMMDSVGDWSERLLGDNPTPLAARFINQLDEEWFDAEPPDALCELIAKRALERVSGWHPGWPHLWGHIQRVTGITMILAEEEGENPALAYVMGICHDVAKLDELRSNDTHEEMSADFTGKVLKGHFKPAEIESIQAAILKEGNDTLADILHDADKLDKIGAAGVLRRVSTEMRKSWLTSALWRVEDDLAGFPPMRFDLSRDLSRSKRDFLAWFLPLADSVIGHGLDFEI